VLQLVLSVDTNQQEGVMTQMHSTVQEVKVLQEVGKEVRQRVVKEVRQRVVKEVVQEVVKERVFLKN
jgi:hypothetical protein